MKVILFGATGMIGAGALLECLDDDDVSAVTAIVRRPTGHTHAKLQEIVHDDFGDLTSIEDQLAGFDACLYCLGISAAGMSEADYRRITYDFTIAAAQSLLRASPGLRMCFISGSGTSADSRMLWARVKAEAEQALLRMPFSSAHMFRPAAIFPRKGVRSGVRSYRIMYAALGWMYPVLKWLMPGNVTTSDQLGRALIRVARDGHEKSILEGVDLNAVTD